MARISSGGPMPYDSARNGLEYAKRTRKTVIRLTGNLFTFGFLGVTQGRSAVCGWGHSDSDETTAKTVTPNIFRS